MSHNLTIRRDGTAEMAYVGPVPWHGLGAQIEKGASLDDIITAAGLAWTAIGTPVEFTANGVRSLFKNRKVLYRSDTGAQLSIMSDGFQPHQPAEIMEFLHAVTKRGGWYIHTAGTMGGGTKIWVMASREDEDSPEHVSASVVTGRDRIKRNLLVATSLDGSLATVAKACNTRTVCNNTFTRSLRESGRAARQNHSKPFDADAMLSAMAAADGEFDSFVAAARRMSELPIGENIARELLRTLLGKPMYLNHETETIYTGTVDGSEFQQLMARGALQTQEKRAVTRCLELFAGAGMGADLPGSAGTRWGLFNAVTQFIDHERGRTVAKRMESAWFGEANQIKAQAMEALA